jgi:hypothetical protein
MRKLLKAALVASTLVFAMGATAASAACVKAIAGVGYQAKVTWIDAQGTKLKTAVVRLGQTKCGPSGSLVSVRTQGAGLAKGFTVVLGTMAVSSGFVVGCTVVGAGCSAASGVTELAFSTLLALPGKNTLFYAKIPSKKYVCLTGSVFSPKAVEHKGKGKRKCVG